MAMNKTERAELDRVTTDAQRLTIRLDSSQSENSTLRRRVELLEDELRTRLGLTDDDLDAIRRRAVTD